MSEVAQYFSRRHNATHFAATVIAESGGTIQVQRDGAAAPEAVFYAALSGVTAITAPGDRVAVVDLTGEGGYVVLGKIVNV